MRVKFQTVSGKIYFSHIEKYAAKKSGKSASEFQKLWKIYFMNLFPKDFWMEEFVIRPSYHNRYRLDLFNFTKKFAVECHGDQHVKVSKHFHGDSMEEFLKSLTKDRDKELWCEANEITLITVYTSTPKELDFLSKKYPTIKWPNKLIAGPSAREPKML